MCDGTTHSDLSVYVTCLKAKAGYGPLSIERLEEAAKDFFNFAYTVTVPEAVQVSNIALDLHYENGNRSLWTDPEHEGVGLLLNGEFHGMRSAANIGNVKAGSFDLQALQAGEVIYFLSESPLNPEPPRTLRSRCMEQNINKTASMKCLRVLTIATYANWNHRSLRLHKQIRRS